MMLFTVPILIAQAGEQRSASPDGLSAGPRAAPSRGGPSWWDALHRGRAAGGPSGCDRTRRGVVGEAMGGRLRADAFGDQAADLKDPFVAGHPDRDGVTCDQGGRGFGRAAVQPDVACAAGGSGRGTCLVGADRPQPRINADAGGGGRKDGHGWHRVYGVRIGHDASTPCAAAPSGRPAQLLRGNPGGAERIAVLRRGLPKRRLERPRKAGRIREAPMHSDGGHRAGPALRVLQVKPALLQPFAPDPGARRLPVLLESFCRYRTETWWPRPLPSPSVGVAQV